MTLSRSLSSAPPMIMTGPGARGGSWGGGRSAMKASVAGADGPTGLGGDAPTIGLDLGDGSDLPRSVLVGQAAVDLLELTPDGPELAHQLLERLLQSPNHPVVDIEHATSCRAVSVCIEMPNSIAPKPPRAAAPGQRRGASGRRRGSRAATRDM